MDPGLLPCSDTDRLSVFDITYGIRLRVLKGDHGDRQVDLRLICQLLILGHNICKEFIVNLKFVPSLLERNTEYILML